MEKVNRSATERTWVNEFLNSANTGQPDEIGNCVPRRVSQTETGAQLEATDVSMLVAVRRMMVLATDGAFDLLDGDPHSENLDRLEALHRKVAGKLAAISARDGNTDFTLLLHCGRDSFENFSESIQREIIDTIHSETGIEVLDAALERVRSNAIAAGAGLALIEHNTSID